MSERSVVQNPLIRYAEAIGWERVSAEKALQWRGGDEGIYFTDLLAEQAQRLNPGVVDAGRAREIVRQLSLLHATIEGNRDALAWLQGQRSVFVPSQNRELNVKLIDYDHPERNIFHVTDEWWQKGPAFRNRADVVFLINGIPVALCETKNATRPDAIAEGVEQIHRYHRETPTMFTATQIFEVTHLIDFFYGATWSTNRKDLFSWKEVESGDYEAKVRRFFDRAEFLKTLRDYIIFLTRDDGLIKIILRQHQMRAVEKVVARIMEGEKRRALIWHTQGSGKTLTMITIAARLMEVTPQGERPTVLMLVDRNELEAQLFRNITAYGIEPRVAQSKADLRDILASDYRGLVVTMIHKFDDIPASVNPRKSIIVLVDEAHRTTGGDLGNYLMGAIPNATYIGFTGTPIDRLSQGEGTFKVFGTDDPQGYLDKYSIAESIADGTTVKLNYALAPSHLRVDRKTLEDSFLNLAQTAGISDIEELNTILDRSVALKEMMKSPERVRLIAEYVAQHFRENVEPMGFKAFLVGVDREACVLYKQALDQHLPPEWSQVVISQAHNDSALLRQYFLPEDAEKRVRRDFARKGTDPRILIVTEKLLTGYDAPILYCMYLDKPMRDHVLLQAIARVNRPYEDDEGLVKPYGFVLDFVGIFEKLEAALAFDSDVVAATIENIDALRTLFENWMRDEAPKYLPFARGWDDKAKERAIDHFQPKERRDEFYKFYRQLQGLYDILSPDAFLRPYLEDYLALSELFLLIRNAYSDHVYTDREVTAKTRELLREHSGGTTIEPPDAVHELGVQQLEALKQITASDTVKVLNLRKLLAVTVQEQGAAQPFLLSIGERAEKLSQAYEDRHLTTQQVLAEFEKLAREAAEAEAVRHNLGIDANTFAIFTVLKSFDGDVTTEQAAHINALFVEHSNYQWSDTQKRALRIALYRALRPLVGGHYIEAASQLLDLRRI